MCHEFLSDASFFQLLTRIDHDLAEQARAHGCGHCGGRLYRANYPRKPRGASRPLLGPEYEWRLSFCCAEEGCRRRMTPPSVRFLGRRVYLGVIVLLVSALANGISAQRGQRLSEQFGVARRTLYRWRRWWREAFVRCPFWRAARGQFIPAVASARLPQSLHERFAGQSPKQSLVVLLRFLSPLTTTSCRIV